VSPRCDDCDAARLTLVTDQARWERRAGIERYLCLRCGAETTIETEPRGISRAGVSP